MKIATHSLRGLCAIASPLLLAACAGGPTLTQLPTSAEKGIVTRASHPVGGSMQDVEGEYLGRRYSTHAGVKTGVIWEDVYRRQPVASSQAQGKSH
ncbi:MAG: hypothetical protein RLZZ142_1834 [Verrucomicrobiota bacterium]